MGSVTELFTINRFGLDKEVVFGLGPTVALVLAETRPETWTRT